MLKTVIAKGRVAVCAALALLLTVSAARADITVSGTGKITVVPDVAFISLAVVTDGDTAAGALDANGTGMRNVLKRLAQFGIAEADVQTTHFGVRPKYRHAQNSEPVLIGYTVTNQISVKIRKLTHTGEVLDGLVKEGANRIDSVTFTVSDPDRLLDEARARAMAHAKRKAEVYANGGEVSLGKVIQITESHDAPSLQWRFEGAQATKGEVPLAPGERELSVQVTVVYATGRASG
jgi:uncharacterized protein YggE